jgi:hypothetical protein
MFGGGTTLPVFVSSAEKAAAKIGTWHRHEIKEISEFQTSMGTQEQTCAEDRV